MRVVFPKYFVFLFLSVVFVLTAQLVRIERPYRGHFASYQGAVMASMARNMLDENFQDILRPKTNALILTSEKTYHLNQYPLPSLIVAAAIKLFGGSFEFWGRLQAIVFNFLSVFFFWGIVRKITDEATAAIACVLFLISPYSVIYGQMFMCEPLALCALLASLFLGNAVALGERKNWLMLGSSALLFSIALLNRIHFVLFLPPMVWGVWRSSRSLKAVFYFLFLLLTLPVAWYGFTYWVSIQNMVRTQTSFFFQASTSDLLWRTSIFSLEYWKRILDIFALNILTPLAFPFLGAGLLFAFQDIRKFGGTLAMFGFCFLTIFLFPQKLMEHDFYLQGLFPIIIFLAAIGIRAIALRIDVFKRKYVVLLALLCFLGTSARYFLHPLFGFSPQERNVAEAGKWLQARTLPSDIIVLAGENTPALSFYVNRKAFGFPLTGPRELPAYFLKRDFNPAERADIASLENAMKNDASLLELFRKKGATYFFLSDRDEAKNNPAFLQYLRDNYSEISPDGTSFYLFKL